MDRPATEFEAAAAIRAFYQIIHAAENGNQRAEDLIVKAAKAIDVKLDALSKIKVRETA